MSDTRLGSTTQYTVHENPTSGKVVIGQKNNNIDQVELAKKLMEAKEATAKTDLTKISKQTQKLTALEELRTRLDNFQAINNPLENYQGTDLSQSNLFHDEKPSFTSLSGEAGENFVSAAVTQGKNLIGSEYSVRVMQTAKKDMKRSDPEVTTPFLALGVNGNLVLNGTSVSINATDTMYDIADKVQAQKSTTNIEANTADADATSGIFWLKATELAIPIDLTGSDAGILRALNIDGSVVATNTLQAQIRVDGYDFYRNSNTITDIIDGVTLTAKAVMSAESTLSFSLNTDALFEKTEEWIKAFNDLKDFIKPHTVKAIDDDPDGEHVLFRETIIDETLKMLNQVGKKVSGLFGDWSDLGTATIEWVKLGDSSSKLKYDPVELKKKIQDNIDSFKQLMGEHFTSTNSQVSVIGFPESLPGPLANKNLTLTISNVGTSAGETVFDATLTDGGNYSETLTQTTSTMTFTDHQNFGGFVLNYDGTVPSGGDTVTLNVTQGVAARMRGKLENFLSEPIDVADLNNKATLNQKDDKVNRGALSRHMYHILKEKKQLEGKVADTKKCAQSAYETSIRQLQRHANEEGKRKRVTDMINVLYKTK